MYFSERKKKISSVPTNRYILLLFLFTKKLMKKKSEFANFLVTFGHGTFLAPVSSKFNVESNPHIHLVYR